MLSSCWHCDFIFSSFTSIKKKDAWIFNLMITTRRCEFFLLMILYRLARENCLSSCGRRCVLFAGLLRSGVLQRDECEFIYMHRAASKASTSLRKRPGFSRSVSHSVSPFLPLLPSPVRRSLPRPRRCGRNYRIFSDASTRAAGGCKRLQATVLVVRWMGKSWGRHKRKNNARRTYARRNRATQSRHASQTRW